MRIERYKDFISEEDRVELVNWFDYSIDNQVNFYAGLSRGEWGYQKRCTTRNTDKVEYPEVALRLFDKVINSFEFQDNCHKEILANKEGIICVATFPTGDTYYHKDPANCKDGLSVIRFNIVLQKPEDGGIISITDENGKEVKLDVDERELYCCNLSDYWHSVSEVKGSKSRYIILFSMCCDKDDWETGKIKFKG